MTVISSVCVSVTALPLSKCSRTHYGGHCELFSGQNALDRMILHMHSTSAWCQLGNGLRIVNGGSGQWKRLYSPGWGMLLMMMMMMMTEQSHFCGGGVIPRTPLEASPVLGPRHQFPLGSPAFPFFLFTKRQLVSVYYRVVQKRIPSFILG